MAKTILVTGGSGFIGFNFIEHISSPTLNIINIDMLTYASVGSHGTWDYLYKTDIRNKLDLNDIFSKHKPEIVINFAAESHVDRSINDSTPFTTTNVVGTQQLLDASLITGVKRFVQVSTDEVYGSLGLSDGPFTEQHRLKPNSPYSASKAAADLIVRSYGQTHGMDVVITRCSNNYGPHQHTEKFIPKTITNILSKKKVPLYGNGTNVRDWIYVKDHCEGIWLAATKGKKGEIYNFGGNEEFANIDIINLIANKIDPSSDNDHYEFVEDRKGHDFRYAIDFSKAKKELGWNPKLSFEEGIEKTIDHYRRYRKNY